MATVARTAGCACAAETLRAALGRGGVRADKEEGDGATPAGLLPLRRVLYRADRVTAARRACRPSRSAPEDGWCDDPAHADYNRQIRLPHPARHEELWRRDEVYDVVGVLGWNDAPVRARPRLGDFPACGARRTTRRPRAAWRWRWPDLLAVLQAGVTALRVRAP